MKRTPFRRLLADSPAAPNRVAYYGLWFRGHNNPRYAELLPRLSRLDRYLLMLPERRIPRGLAYRAARVTRYVRDPLVLAAVSRRYRFLLTADPEQIRRFDGRVVADIDDPTFTPREVELLQRPNLAAYVVTAERAARRFEALGVTAPWYVIPQGVSLSSVDAAEVETAAARRRPDEVTVGYMAAWLLSAEDRNGDNPLHNVDHLLDLWDRVHARVPAARLWLVGGASERVRARVAGRDDVVVFGRLPRGTALAHVANFDVALYPRTRDQGIQAAKVAEYMGLGVPTVSYDYEVTRPLRETGAGVLVQEPDGFVDAVVRLAQDNEARETVAAAARAAGKQLDWDLLARRYETEVLDRYLA